MTDYAAPPTPPSTPVYPRRLSRSTNNRVFAGVAGGLAEYMDLDATVVRAGFVIGSLLLGGVGGPLLYLLAWAIMPEEGKDNSIASDALRAKPWQNWGAGAPGVPGSG